MATRVVSLKTLVRFKEPLFVWAEDVLLEWIPQKLPRRVDVSNLEQLVTVSKAVEELVVVISEAQWTARVTGIVHAFPQYVENNKILLIGCGVLSAFLANPSAEYTVQGFRLKSLVLHPLRVMLRSSASCTLQQQRDQQELVREHGGSLVMHTTNADIQLRHGPWTMRQLRQYHDIEQHRQQRSETSRVVRTVGERWFSQLLINASSSPSSEFKLDATTVVAAVGELEGVSAYVHFMEDKEEESSLKTKVAQLGATFVENVEDASLLLYSAAATSIEDPFLEPLAERIRNESLYVCASHTFLGQFEGTLKASQVFESIERCRLFLPPLKSPLGLSEWQGLRIYIPPNLFHIRASIVALVKKYSRDGPATVLSPSLQTSHVVLCDMVSTVPPQDEEEVKTTEDNRRENLYSNEDSRRTDGRSRRTVICFEAGVHDSCPFTHKPTCVDSSTSRLLVGCGLFTRLTSAATSQYIRSIIPALGGRVLARALTDYTSANSNLTVLFVWDGEAAAEDILPKLPHIRVEFFEQLQSSNRANNGQRLISDFVVYPETTAAVAATPPSATAADTPAVLSFRTQADAWVQGCTVVVDESNPVDKSRHAERKQGIFEELSMLVDLWKKQVLIPRRFTHRSRNQVRLSFPQGWAPNTFSSPEIHLTALPPPNTGVFCEWLADCVANSEHPLLAGVYNVDGDLVTARDFHRQLVADVRLLCRHQLAIKCEVIIDETNASLLVCGSKSDVVFNSRVTGGVDTSNAAVAFSMTPHPLLCVLNEMSQVPIGFCPVQVAIECGGSATHEATGFCLCMAIRTLLASKGLYRCWFVCPDACSMPLVGNSEIPLSELIASVPLFVRWANGEIHLRPRPPGKTVVITLLDGRGDDSATSQQLTTAIESVLEAEWDAPPIVQRAMFSEFMT